MSKSYEAPIELRLRPTLAVWLSLMTALVAALSTVIWVDTPWRPLIFLLWVALGLVEISRLADRRWDLLRWQASGAIELLAEGESRPASLGPNNYIGKHMIVLHILCGGKSWYFCIPGITQKDAFRRALVRLRTRPSLAQPGIYV